MKNRIIIIIILGLGLLLRTGYLLESYRQNPTFSTPIIDSFTYDSLAQAQVAGEGMGPDSVWQPLFYPYFLAGVYQVFGRDLFLVRVVQVLLGIGTIYLTFLLGRMLFSFAVGTGAAALVAISGPLIFYEGELLGTTWEAAWFLFSLILFVRLDQQIAGRKEEADQEQLSPGTQPDATFWQFCGLGVVCGVGVVIRPTILLFYLSGMTWLLVRQYLHNYRNWRAAAATGASFLLGIGLILGPVAIRNHRVTGHWVLMPLSGGLNFYIGNNPQASETIATRPGEGWRQLTVLSRQAGIFHEPYGSQYFYDQGREYVRNHPTAFLRGLVKKTTLLFSGREIPRNLDIYHFRDFSSILRILIWRTGNFAFPMGVILPLTLLGMALSLSRWKRLALLYIFVAAYSLAIVLFFVTARYRMPLLPAFIIFCAAGFQDIIRLFQARRWKTFTAAVAALAALLIFCNRPIAIPEDGVNFRSELYLSLGSVHLQEGRLKQAEEFLNQAIELEPENTEALYLLGSAAFQREETEKAGELFRRTLRFRPDHSAAHKGLGRVHDRLEQPQEALVHWREAAHLDTGDVESRLRLAELYEAAGEKAAAIREYWSALHLTPDDIALRRKLAFLSGEAGQWEISRDLIGEALRHHPEDATLLCDIGVIYANLDRPEEAIAAFQAALVREPGLPAARFNLEALTAQGKANLRREESCLIEDMDQY